MWWLLSAEHLRGPCANLWRFLLGQLSPLFHTVLLPQASLFSKWILSSIRSFQGFHWAVPEFILSVPWLRSPLKAVIGWGSHRARLICFLVFEDYYSWLPDVLCLENLCLISFVHFLVVSDRSVNLVSVIPFWLESSGLKRRMKIQLVKTWTWEKVNLKELILWVSNLKGSSQWFDTTVWENGGLEK